MVKKLRKKFILTAMGALSIILVVLIVSINLIYLYQSNHMADEVLAALESNYGVFPEHQVIDVESMMPEDQAGVPPEGLPPEPPPEGFHGPQGDGTEASGQPWGKKGRGGKREGFDPGRVIGILPGAGDDDLAYSRDAERPFNTRYFSVAFYPGADGTYQAAFADVEHIAALSEEEAVSYAEEVLAREQVTHEIMVNEPYNEHGRTAYRYGNIGTYRYLLCGYIAISSYTARVYFIDRAEDIFQARQLLWISLLIGFVALVAMFLLVLLFSGRAVRPVVESLEKQKHFITDAGHELKTPLSVISADVDVMEIEGGKSEWTASIRSQVKRMTELVGNLLTISKMDEEIMPQSFVRTDFSALLTKCRDSFLAVAEDRSLGYTAEIEEGVAVRGDAEALTRLCTLLLDNALKYCKPEGTVHVALSAKGRNVMLVISNPCETMPEGNLDRLFDRFYRADASRSRKSGGYGIGLSAARSIAEAHGGEIHAEAADAQTIRFVTKLPLAGEA